MLININGKITDAAQASISVLDRGFLFSDSIYEVTRTYNKIPFLLDQHLERLEKSANILAMELSYSITFFKQEILKTVEAFFKQFNQEAYIRLIVTRGMSDMGLAPIESLQNNFVIIVKTQPDNPDWWYKKGVSFIVADNRKTPKQTIDPNCKSGNHLPHVMALKQTKKAGAFDAILLNQDCYVTEGTSNNIWMVKKNTVITPPLQSGILEGITRATILKILKDKKMDFKEKLFKPEELYSADESFFTSSTREIVPIVRIDDQPIGLETPGPLYSRIHQLYTHYIQTYITTHKQQYFEN